MRFYDYTIVAGEPWSRREHDSMAMVRRAVAIFGRMLDAHGTSFREAIPYSQGYELQWTLYGSGAALATFWFGGVPVTSSLLFAGVDPDSECEMLERVEGLLQTGGAAAGAGQPLRAITERPVILTIVLPSAIGAGQEAIGIIADMESCLAAAFFEATRPQRGT